MRKMGRWVGVMLLLLVAAHAQAEPVGAQATWPNRGRLGIEVQSMTDALREFFGAPADRGVLVVRVIAERAAAHAGIQVGDVLATVGGAPIADPLDLIAAVARVPAGEKLALEVVRRGKTETISVAPEGDPVAFTRPDHEEKGADGFHGEMRRAVQDGRREILQRLESIEGRLEKIEPKPSAAPSEERN